MLRHLARLGLALAFALNATPLCAQTPAPSPSPATSSTQSLSPLGGSLALPAYGGYGGKISYTNTDVQAASVTLTMSTQPPPGPSIFALDSALGTSLVYLTAVFSPTIRFSGGIGVTSFTLPPNVSASGHSFVFHLYDLTTAQYLNTTPGAPSSNSSVAFPQAISNAPVPGGHVFLVVLQML